MQKSNAASLVPATKSGYRNGANELLLAKAIIDYQKNSDHVLLKETAQAANWQLYMRANDGKSNAYTTRLRELRQATRALLSDLDRELEMLNQPADRG